MKAFCLEVMLFVFCLTIVRPVIPLIKGHIDKMYLQADINSGNHSLLVKKLLESMAKKNEVAPDQDFLNLKEISACFANAEISLLSQVFFLYTMPSFPQRENTLPGLNLSVFQPPEII